MTNMRQSLEGPPRDEREARRNRSSLLRLIDGARSAARIVKEQRAKVYRHLRRMGRAGDPLRVPYIWLRKPEGLVGREVCLFMTFDKSGRVPQHALFHARAWATQGFDVVMIVALEDVAFFEQKHELNFAAGILLRGNIGYDFGAWATAIRLLPELANAARVAIVNDSVYGPMVGFKAMIDRARRLSADFVGGVESLEYRPHIQSFLIFFNPSTLRARAFWRFWQSVRVGNRDQVVRDYELTLSRRLIAAGLKLEFLFRTPKNYKFNPTVTRWRELISQGFPYVKRQVLKASGSGSDSTTWRQIVKNNGLDPALIEEHLLSLERD